MYISLLRKWDAIRIYRSEQYVPPENCPIEMFCSLDKTSFFFKFFKCVNFSWFPWTSAINLLTLSLDSTIFTILLTVCSSFGFSSSTNIRRPTFPQVEAQRCSLERVFSQFLRTFCLNRGKFHRRSFHLYSNSKYLALRWKKMFLGERF